MKSILKNMVRRAWSIIISGSRAWDEIAAAKEPVAAIRRQYVYPWIAACAAVSFIFNLLYASARAFEAGISNAVTTLLSLTGGYFISNLVCFAYLKRKRPRLASKTDCETIAAYSFTIIILIEMLTAVMPSLFFLRILSIFTAYAVWEGCRAVWKLPDDERGSVVLVFSITIIFVPVIISYLIHWMLPNM